jgi:hypothetical protein
MVLIHLSTEVWKYGDEIPCLKTQRNSSLLKKLSTAIQESVLKR